MRVAEEFNKHYSTVADKILMDRKYEGKQPFNSYLKNPNEKSFMLTPTTPTEIVEIISKFDITKSAGPNSIPNQILQSIKCQISIPLANIFNASFQSGTCPDSLKTSIVIPIHKKDSKLLVSNYRPISLLSNINKILEKLVFPTPLLIFRKKQLHL